jgi:hypothetical protein
MQLSYTLRPVLAEQFVATVTPWPTGVTADQTCISGYLFQSPTGARFMIWDGDYIVAGSRVVPRAEFESQFVV